MDYVRRVVETELDEIADLPAILLHGAKGVGKTATALTRARTVYRLDQPGQVEIIRADPARLTQGDPPILIDEWQRWQPSWDVVRAAVDADRSPGRFLLTGSSQGHPEHTGAARIVPVRMRPMALAERGVGTPTVSLRALLRGDPGRITGRTGIALGGYVDEILASGFPGLRGLSARSLTRALDGYVDLIAEREFPLLGVNIRNRAALIRWMTAYAAATATTATFETIRDAATGNEGRKPARTTVAPYHDALAALWIVDPLPAWSPSTSAITRVTGPSKHHLADPALAARLLNVDREALLAGLDVPPQIPRTGSLLGALFESLASLSVRVFAEAAGATVSHLRTKGGEREVDFIVETTNRRVVALEAKLSATIGRDDTTNLRWLAARLGDRFAGGVVLSTGPEAYRDEDGIAIVPLALLGQ